MRKIKNIIALACAAFIVVCNLKYAHDGYGIRNTKPEERAYATTAKPTFRHEKYPYHMWCDAITVPIYAKWLVKDNIDPLKRKYVSETHFATCYKGDKIENAVVMKVQELELMGACEVVVDSFYSITLAPYSTYELRCEPSGTMTDCQDKTEECPMIS